MREFKSSEGPFPIRLLYEVKEIDDICIGALREAKLLPPEPEAIKIDLFLEKYFEVPILYEDIGEGVMGSTVFDSIGRVTGFTIAPWLEEDGTATSDRRVRSTLAHEGGHGLLHPRLFMSEQTGSLFGSRPDKNRPQKFLCRSSDINPGVADKPRYDGQWWEWQANRAIGGLLLPKVLVLKLIAPFLDESDFGKELNSEKRTKAVEAVSDTFEVNPVVARIRLEEMFPRDGQQTM